MKKQKRKKIIMLLILFILILFLFQMRKNQNPNFQDDLIFFKLFSSKQEESKDTVSIQNQSYPQYNFQVSYKNIDFKKINLSDTIKQDTLIHEKIAPGTEGAFEIFLQSNRKLNYRIQFKSTNEKPENLYFQIEGKDRKYDKLENMEQELKGELTENKRIIIHWKWEYERNQKQNLQDTNDGQKIKQYNFMIYTIGE